MADTDTEVGELDREPELRRVSRRLPRNLQETNKQTNKRTDEQTNKRLTNGPLAEVAPPSSCHGNPWSLSCCGVQTEPLHPAVLPRGGAPPGDDECDAFFLRERSPKKLRNRCNRTISLGYLNRGTRNAHI